MVVAIAVAISQQHAPGATVNADDRDLISLGLWRQPLGKGSPDGARATAAREPKPVVRSPRDLVAIRTDCLHDPMEVRLGDSFADPLVTEHFEWVCPNLAVIGTHEGGGEAVAHHGCDPLVEVADGGGQAWRSPESVQAAVALGLRQPGEVVLQRVRNESLTHPDPAFALMPVPSFGSDGKVHGVI